MNRKQDNDNANDAGIHADDPRVTAYALGELTGAEAVEIETAINGSQALQQAVASVRETANQLKLAFEAEPMVGLTKDRREAIESRISKRSRGTGKRKANRMSRLSKAIWISSGLAACILLSLSILLPSLSRAREYSSRGYVAAPTPSRNAGRLRALGYSGDNRNERPQPTGGINVLIGEGYADSLRTPIDLAGGTSLTYVLDKTAADQLVITGSSKALLQAERLLADTDGDGIPDAVAVGESTTERYAHIRENAFKLVRREPLSTFSIDVDTASYSNVRRFLRSGQLPPPDAVRIEEFVNYFSYDYPQPEGDAPFSINVDVSDCPWNRDHRLARIGLQGYEIPNEERPYSNLVFLIDVSGSMASDDKLPLLKQSMRILIDELDEYDRVAILVYAGASGLVLDSTTCDQKEAVIDALENLQPGGSTNGAAGIELAYEIAAENFIEDGTNRVILATDGDFNVGVTSEVELHKLIEVKAKTGVFLTALGFGGGNYQDATLELLADKGNGNYAYIDTLQEAQKVLVEQMGGTLVTIAKDVKIQVEFNPSVAGAYRLIGYENRMLAKEDFNDDTKDAGEIGAGHTVTALYEIIPAGEPADFPDVDPLKYQLAEPAPTLVANDELMTVKVRYKRPDEDKSTRLELPVVDQGAGIDDASDDFRFAASVASFGMLLRHSAYRGETDFERVLELAESRSGDDRSTAREGFVELVDIAEQLMNRSADNDGAYSTEDTTEDVDE